MSLPDYFGKAALSASHVLRNFDFTAFEQLLEGSLVAICFDNAAEDSPEGRALLNLLVRLLSRLYPNLAVQGPDGPLLAELTSLALRINPEVNVSAPASKADVTVSVGANEVSSSKPVVYAGSDGWVAYLSSSRPISVGQTLNPFGAGAAAAFAAANVFRLIFKDSLARGQADEELTFSVLSCAPDTQGAGKEPESIDLGETHLAGVGAIGQASVWALARIPDLRGVLSLVDPETVDLPNLQRYVLTERTDVERGKVELAQAFLRQPDLRVQPCPLPWSAHARAMNWRLERVGAALDTAEDRIALQASLPRWVANAWTQTGDLGISRHDFLHGACLACLYWPQPMDKSRSLLVAEAVGMPEAEPEIRHLLATGRPLDPELTDRIAYATGVPPELLKPYIGQSLDVLYGGAVCGGLILQAGGRHGLPRSAEVPLAFQSALAGILLAAELVIHAGGLREQSTTTVTSIDLTRPLTQRLTFPRAKDESHDCICQDGDFVSQYVQKYGPNPSWIPERELAPQEAIDAAEEEES